MESGQAVFDLAVLMFFSGGAMAFGGLFAWAIWSWVREVLSGRRIR